MIFHNHKYILELWFNVKVDRINYIYVRIKKTTPPDVGNNWILIHIKNHKDEIELLYDLQHDINFIEQLYYYPKNVRLEYYKSWHLKPLYYIN